jgi:hypothetical protein
LSGTGFQNKFSCDPSVVGFLRGPTMGWQDIGLERELGCWLRSYWMVRSQARRRMCRLYVWALICSGHRTSIQPMTERLALGDTISGTLHCRRGVDAAYIERELACSSG